MEDIRSSASFIVGDCGVLPDRVTPRGLTKSPAQKAQERLAQHDETWGPALFTSLGLDFKLVPRNSNNDSSSSIPSTSGIVIEKVSSASPALKRRVSVSSTNSSSIGLTEHTSATNKTTATTSIYSTTSSISSSPIAPQPQPAYAHKIGINAVACSSSPGMKPASQPRNRLLEAKCESPLLCRNTPPPPAPPPAAAIPRSASFNPDGIPLTDPTSAARKRRGSTNDPAGVISPRLSISEPPGTNSPVPPATAGVTGNGGVPKDQIPDSFLVFQFPPPALGKAARPDVDSIPPRPAQSSHRLSVQGLSAPPAPKSPTLAPPANTSAFPQYSPRLSITGLSTNSPNNNNNPPSSAPTSTSTSRSSFSAAISPRDGSIFAPPARRSSKSGNPTRVAPDSSEVTPNTSLRLSGSSNGGTPNSSNKSQRSPSTTSALAVPGASAFSPPRRSPSKSITPISPTTAPSGMGYSSHRTSVSASSPLGGLI